jgi:competence ComEA-like helix-hairpin-helix protein
MRLTFPEMWTPQQRTVLIVLILALAGLVSMRLIRDDQMVPRELPDEGPRANEVMSQLDLNTADAASLSAIPRLGIAKAQAIVAYREQFVAAHPGQRAFEQMETLFRIKGIGPATMELLRKYTFIINQAATNPTR